MPACVLEASPVSAREENIQAWRSVAAGWERQRALIWSATHVVSERLVELLDPRPGQSVLELAAGPGDTGFLAYPRILPGGQLLTTDVAPEMLEAARRRAAELGLDNVTFAVEDAASLTLADASVDGVLCRWGLMLVPDMEGAAAEIARVLRPGGRAAVAVWASPEENEWMTAGGRSVPKAESDGWEPKPSSVSAATAASWASARPTVDRTWMIAGLPVSSASSRFRRRLVSWSGIGEKTRS